MKNKKIEIVYYQESFEDSKLGNGVCLFLFDDYVIADFALMNSHYFYLKNPAGDILETHHNFGEPFLMTSKDDETTVFLLMQLTKDPIPLFSVILEALENKDMKELINSSNNFALNISILDFSNSDHLEIDTTIYEPEDCIYRLSFDEQLRAEIDSAIFDNILPLFYEFLNIYNAYNHFHRRSSFDIDQKFIKNLKEIEGYRETIEVPEDVDEEQYIRNYKRRRTAEENAKLTPDYNRAFNEVIQAIDQIIGLEKKYMALDWSQLEVNERLDKRGLTFYQPIINIPELLLSSPSRLSDTIFHLKSSDFKNWIAQRNIHQIIKKGSEETHVSTLLEVCKDQRVSQEIQNFLSTPIDGPYLISGDLDAKTKRVHNAVMTLVDNYIRLNPQESFDNGCAIPITINQIHRAMGGKRRPTQVQRKSIIESMFKLGNVWMWMDAEQEYQARGIDLEYARKRYGEEIFNPFTYDRVAKRLVNANPVQGLILPRKANKNTQPEDGFIITELMPIYVYSKITGQITSVPAEWMNLELKTIDSKTKQERIIQKSGNITSLLLEIATRIKRAHYFKENSNNGRNSYNHKDYNKLVFDDLFREAGIEIHSKKTRYKYIEYTKSILEAFKEKNIIIRYEISYRVKTMHAVRFYV